MVYYVQLALEIFMTNFSGATGHVSFELDGGRTPNSDYNRDLSVWKV
jgi:hypothetical protein